ncbi:response regulator transcription factor [Clostridium sp. SHJSY1]|uniref:response regulator transcription factor n=1 Tax=Clostridium sp. SHJSY1 TaxID=2942483 RepID=UPI0028749960|nr:response regulator transcription factor [Clostridium sp. SHJSY1]MDS0528425.1 response regulator transcription factor [Clostridium sp. SHJSY1]
MITVIIAEDQKLLRESFKNVIENNSDIKVLAAATNGLEAYDLCKKHKPDVVLMDLFMPICNGTKATKIIKSDFPSTKVLVLSASTNKKDISDAICSGADGYILKDIGTEQLIAAIEGVYLGLGIINKDVLLPILLEMNNETKTTKKKNVSVDIAGIKISLSERELQIVSMIVDGKDNKQIGAALFIAEGTVKNIITEINSKLQLKDRTQLAVYAVKNKLV